MPLISIRIVPVADRHRLGQRAAVPDAQLLDRAERGRGRATDIVGPRLQLVELLDDGQWHDDVVVAERVDARPDRRSTPTCRARAESWSVPIDVPCRSRAAQILAAARPFGLDEIGHRHSSLRRLDLIAASIPRATWFEVPQRLVVVSHGQRSMVDGRSIDPRGVPARGAGAAPWHRSRGASFCDIVRGSVDADVVLRDDVAVAFLDRSPLFLGHTLVVPLRHVVALPDLDVAEVGPFFERVRLIAGGCPVRSGRRGRSSPTTTS